MNKNSISDYIVQNTNLPSGFVSTESTSCSCTNDLHMFCDKSKSGIQGKLLPWSDSIWTIDDRNKKLIEEQSKTYKDLWIKYNNLQDEHKLEINKKEATYKHLEKNYELLTERYETQYDNYTSYKTETRKTQDENNRLKAENNKLSNENKNLIVKIDIKTSCYDELLKSYARAIVPADIAVSRVDHNSNHI